MKSPFRQVGFVLAVGVIVLIAIRATAPNESRVLPKSAAFATPIPVSVSEPQFDSAAAADTAPAAESPSVVFLAPPDSLGGRIERLSAKDPRATAMQAAALGAEDGQLEALSAALRIWVQLAPGEALDFARGWRDPQSRQMILEQTGRMLALQDPRAALSLSAEFPEGRSQEDYINTVVHSWSRLHPQEAADWARQLPAGERRDQLQSSIAIEWAQEEPAQAADFVATEFHAGRGQEEAALTVCMRWASLEPQAAATWVSQFPAGPLRNQMLQGVMSYWNARSTSAASQWVSSLPAGEFRNAALGVIPPAPAQASRP